jgi:hypothetical protein
VTAGQQAQLETPGGRTREAALDTFSPANSPAAVTPMGRHGRTPGPRPAAARAVTVLGAGGIPANLAGTATVLMRRASLRSHPARETLKGSSGRTYSRRKVSSTRQGPAAGPASTSQYVDQPAKDYSPSPITLSSPPPAVTSAATTCPPDVGLPAYGDSRRLLRKTPPAHLDRPATAPNMRTGFARRDRARPVLDRARQGSAFGAG